jgi:hypothetical protein
MKQHIKTIIIVLLLLALLPGIIIATGIAMPDYYQESYYAQLPAMYQRLKETEGPKIVVVGGSNVAFGLDTALMEQLLKEKGYDYTVCSFGLYAAVGTSAMLELSEDTLGEGDIVILAFEPTSETMSTYFGATAFLKCMENAPELIWKLSRAKQDALIGNYLSYVQERYDIFTSGMLPQVQGVYAKASFNERCDMIFDRPGNIMPLGYDTAAPVDLAAVTVAEDFAQQVNEYCQKARRAGAQVYLSFSPVNRTALVGEEQEAVRTFFELCNTTFDCPVISDQRSYIMDSGWFYDTNFHLNSAGAVVRTCLLTEDILAQLGCYEEVTYDLPPMPGSVAAEYESTGEADWFVFEGIKDQNGQVLGYLISGLSSSGLERTELTAPAQYLGKPVVGLTADSLVNASALEILRLPETIESLPDGLLSQCPVLKQLILEHKTRLCAVTDHTFDSTDQLKIFVPAEAFALYRDGDGCETNLWAQYLDRIYPYQ